MPDAGDFAFSEGMCKASLCAFSSCSGFSCDIAKEMFVNVVGGELFNGLGLGCVAGYIPFLWEGLMGGHRAERLTSSRHCMSV